MRINGQLNRLTMRVTRLVLIAAAGMLLSLLACGEPAGQPAPVKATAEYHTYLPTITRDSAQTAAGLLQPADFHYLGAFRLPGEDTPPQTFAYGGSAMTFYPNGDPAGAADGFHGSLFITGIDRQAYGALPNGSQVAEVGIPAPVIAGTVESLSTAQFTHNFTDVAAGFFTGLDEIPRLGLQYLDTPLTGPKLHLAWGAHLQPDPPQASHAWFEPDLAHADLHGTWFIGSQSLYSTNGYLLEIPADWAAQHTGGRVLGSGRFRDGGMGGMGPALFAYRPWDDAGSPPPDGAHLPETVLLLYENSLNTEAIERSLAGYQHADEWEGAAWLTTVTGEQALVFAGTKAIGARYWYGYVNPAGPEFPCVDASHVGEFPVCRLANGSPCPPQDLVECPGHTSYRGWWSARFEARLLLYDPAQLAQVAAGQLPSWQPQPYAWVDLEPYLFHNPAGIEVEMLGVGVQRRYRIGEAAFDRAHGLLYVLELFADGAKPVVHVWRIAPAA